MSAKKRANANTKPQSAGKKTTLERKPSAPRIGKTRVHHRGHAKSNAKTESKLQKCLTLLSSADGATIEELMIATAWQAHSVRGFLAGTVKKKLGLTLNSKKAADGVRRYVIVKTGA